MVKKGVGFRSSLVMLLVITLLISISTTVFAVGEGELCTEDGHCDTDLYCVDYFCSTEESTTTSTTTDDTTTDDTTSSDEVTCLTDDDCDFYLGSGYECDIDWLVCVEASDDDSSTSEADLESIQDNQDDIATLTDDVSLLNSQLSGIDSRLLAVETTTTSTSSDITAIDTSLTTIDSSVTQLTTKVDTLNTNIQLLSTDQNQLERNIEQEVNTLQAQVGNSIATLEQEIDTAKGDLDDTKVALEAQEKKAQNYRTVTLIVGVIAIFSAIAYVLMVHSKRQTQLPKEAKQFITDQIKSGQTKHQITTSLQKSGWSEHDAQWAYDHTKTENYNEYLISQGKDPKALPARKAGSGHHQKALAISIISILILGVMLFFVKNSVGNAIFITGSGTQSDLSETVESLLETYVDQNAFYNEIDYIELCVQVDDGSLSSSWLVLKTPYGHSVTQNDACEWDPTDYDFAIKFTNYNSFESAMTSLTCTNAGLVHRVLSGSSVTRGAFVLPSYFIDEGMSAKSSVDYSDYCDALSLCFSASDIVTLGVNDC